MGLFQKQETLVAIDIGASAIKLAELDLSATQPRLTSVGMLALSSDCIANHMVVKKEKVAEAIAQLLEANEVAPKRLVIGMPGPTVFMKRVQVSRVPLKELRDHITLEAANYIPHSVENIRLDFHILGDAGKSQLNVLLVAVKNEIIDSYLETVALAGLEAAIVDVDYFAMQNIFELGYPELMPKTVALVNIGTRFSSINICKGGTSLFAGDVSLGGRQVTDDIVEHAGVNAEQAEALKKSNTKDNSHEKVVAELLDSNTEHIASELNRNLSFFWNAAQAGDDGIDQILLCGGGSRLSGLVEELSSKTGIECGLLDPLKGIELDSSIDQAYVKEMAPQLAVVLGLALRQTGDRAAALEEAA